MSFLKVLLDKPAKYISGGHFIAKAPWIHKKRIIDSFEIIIGVSGTAFIQQDNERYEVIPGKVLLLLPHHTHLGYEVSEPNVSFYWFHFNFHNSYNILTDKEGIYEISLAKNKSRSDNNSLLIPTILKPKNIDKINIIFHQLMHIANSNYYTSQSCNFLLTYLLTELSEEAICNYYDSLEEDSSNRKIANILEWIRVHSAEDISVEGLAELFSYNKDYLSRIFKQKTGMNILEYIHLIKISKAKSQLYESDKTIKQIAFSLGFNDEKYFMKLFKKYENMTPSEFRNAYCRIHMNNH